MNSDIVEIYCQNEKCYIKHEGQYLNIKRIKNTNETEKDRINIPLFYKIACFTSVKRSYKTVMPEFFNELKKENIKYFFRTKEDLENATQACGKPGGHIAYLLGLFCRYYNKLPRNVNIVWACCENCRSNISKCGKLKNCGNYFGCGDGVIIPLEPVFNIDTIPNIRRSIETEVFPEPKIATPDVSHQSHNSCYVP
jgi:hypothetical protein